MELNEYREKVLGGVFGLCVGDALGVPVEGAKRSRLEMAPVKDYREFGSHNQPAGTWSDDSSMALCLMDSLRGDYDPEDIALKFNEWWKQGLWTAHGHAFDIGRTVSRALKNHREGKPAVEAGVKGEFGNGNGALMRILPLVFYTMKDDSPRRHALIAEVSSITHGHPRGILACVYYVEAGIALLRGLPMLEAFKHAARVTKETRVGEYRAEFTHFERLFEPESLMKEGAKTIKSDGYVMHTLEAALWCLLRGESYGECVLAAVNLGGDTDTTAAVCGGPAGIFHGFAGIPVKWKKGLARAGDIVRLCDEFARAAYGD